MINKKFIQNIKKTLLLEKDKLLNKSTQSVDIDHDGDETDEIQANLLMQMNNQLVIRNNSKLSKIENALSRIADKTYGLCQECGDEISEKRLLANPHFLDCVFCAEEREKEEKQRKRF